MCPGRISTDFILDRIGRANQSYLKGAEGFSKIRESTAVGLEKLE